VRKQADVALFAPALQRGDALPVGVGRGLVVPAFPHSLLHASPPHHTFALPLFLRCGHCVCYMFPCRMFCFSSYFTLRAKKHYRALLHIMRRTVDASPRIFRRRTGLTRLAGSRRAVSGTSIA